jgi:RNA polymerase sigma-70 factor, ECF subfamily
MSSETQLPVSAPGEEFVQLFTRCQRRLYLFILGQVPRPNDAEEILQNTNVVIWSKCDQFEPGTNFVAWAMTITRLEILKYRQKHARDKLTFSDEFVSRVAAAMEADTDMLDRRRQALASCLGKLKSDDRDLISRRYAPGASGKSVARALKRPANSVYQSIGRIRQMLLECIERQLKLAEQSI